MLETYGESLKEIQQHFDRRHPPASVVMETAVLMEGLMLRIFRDFFPGLRTRAEREVFITWEKKTREKFKDFPDKLMLGRAIGAYRSLCRAFPAHPWIDETVSEDLDPINRSRIRAAHPEKGKVGERDAAKALKLSRRVLDRTGFSTVETRPLNFDLRPYLRYRRIKDEFETAATPEAYGAIVRTARTVAAGIFPSVLNRYLPEMGPGEKEALLPDLEWTHQGNGEPSPLADWAALSARIELHRRLTDGRELPGLLAEVVEPAVESGSRLTAESHLHLLDILFHDLIHENSNKYLDFANQVREFCGGTHRIGRTDRQRLMGVAIHLEIHETIAARIQEAVIRVLRDEGVELAVEPDLGGEEPEPHRPAKRRRRWRVTLLRSAAAMVFLVVIAAAGLYLMIPEARRHFDGWAGSAVRSMGLAAPPETWVEPETGMTFVRVPGGCFEMGCDEPEGDCIPFETPRHRVCLDPFWIGKFEVTQGQWTAVMGENPSAFSDCGDDCPVEMVSWEAAQAFIEKLGEKTGKRFALPTEAQWEYACRSGGYEQRYAGESENPGRVAWYTLNSGRKTHPVGEKSPNGLGLHDMSGNVWEWCEDRFSETAYEHHGEQNPVGAHGATRVIRGGAWSFPDTRLRCGYRSDRPPDRGTSHIGVRLVGNP